MSDPPWQRSEIESASQKWALNGSNFKKAQFPSLVRANFKWLKFQALLGPTLRADGRLRSLPRQARTEGSCINQLKAQGPSRTFDESKEEEEKEGAGVTWSGASPPRRPGSRRGRTSRILCPFSGGDPPASENFMSDVAICSLPAIYSLPVEDS